WHHAVLTKSGTTLQIYIDGELKVTNGNVRVEPADGALYLGSNKTATLGHFSGALDDVRVYDRVLDASQVLALYGESQNGSLVAHWTFDEMSGTVARDASGNGNTGTLVNGPTWVAGQLGGALSFDGIDDRIDTAKSPLDPGATDFSLALWFRVGSLDDEHFVSQTDGTGTGRVWLAKDPRNGLYSNLGGRVTSSQFLPVLGQWHHAALTKSGTTLRLYVDGALRATSTGVAVEPANGILRLGSKKTGVDNFLNSLMDDVRIYNRALTDTEIAGLYQTMSFPAWTRWETSLTSSVAYANPYADVTVVVTYTGPDGQTFTGNAFWDGGNTFRLRFMFPAAGTWTWTTAASDTGNAGLHDRTGSVTVAPYTGSNALYARGYPRVSANRRYLTYADGTPFLWLGDTAWSAPMAASQAEWESYVQLRKAQKFNVIQVHSRDGWVNLSADRDGNPPFRGTGATLAWNPAYWQGVEKKVQYANDQGLMVYFTAVRQPGPGFPDTDSIEVARFARNLAARMMGNFVVYSPVADDLWTQLADVSGSELAASTSVHLISAHPRFFLAPAEVFHGKNYVAVSGLQSGNGWTYDPYFREPFRPFDPIVASQAAIDWTLALYNRLPTKPVINQEVVYDSLNLQNGDTGDYIQPYPIRLPRSTAYLAMLSGSAGLTYGTGGVWNWGRNVGNATAGWSLSQALARPSAREMQYLFELFSGLEWWNLVPSHESIRNQPADGLGRMAMARTRDGGLGVAYLPDNASIVLDMAGFSGPMEVRWFNPVTNTFVTEPSRADNTGLRSFVKPEAWADAILILRR
ncbi:MAG: DUF4038 domain-containing protein, partial [Gammaproteobacteria bacterium]|nr:DUF4038 domain-containing protein [Gammaproteobacteria bacterium]